MGKLSGTVLIFAGLALGGYTLSTQDQDAGSKTAATAQSGSGAEKGAAAPQGADPSASTTESSADLEPVKAALHQDEADAEPPAAPAPVAPAQQPSPASQPVVVGVAEAPPRVPVGETAAAGPGLDRPALTREIQRQLKRVGCYRGTDTGVWSQSVQDAMKTFTDRVNASLPIDRPDPVLLAMVQSQKPGVCSASCPAGQERAAGSCLPSAVVAASAKAGSGAKRQAAAAAKTAQQPDAPAVRDALATEPAEGRMSLAGPRAGAPRQAATPAPVTRWKAPASRQAQPATPQRSARARVRQRAAERSYGYNYSSGYSGFPSWVPFW
jgi:hypothetical protein